MNTENTIRRFYISGPSLYDEPKIVSGFLYTTDSDYAKSDSASPEEMRGLWIEHVTEGTTSAGIPIKAEDGIFHLLIERSEWQTTNLTELELRLMLFAATEDFGYDFGAFNEFGCDMLIRDSGRAPNEYLARHWQSVVDSTELNEFIQEYCAARGIKCDGDVFGDAFSGESERTGNGFAWDVRECIRIIEQSADIYELRKA